MDELSRDLHAELAPHGVTVENQAPFYVATKMSKIRRPRLDAPSPATWVRSVGSTADVVDPTTQMFATGAAEMYPMSQVSCAEAAS